MNKTAVLENEPIGGGEFKYLGNVISLNSEAYSENNIQTVIQLHV
jgi:hypothetical protein